MKKIFIVLLILCLSFLPTTILASAESQQFKVCTNQTSVFLEPNLESEKLETIEYGNLVEIGNLVDGTNTNLTFYEVIKNEEVFGYVISTTVCKNEEVYYKLQTNARLKNDCEVFASTEEEKLTIGGQEITLIKDSEIKLLEKYNASEKYSKIAFQKDDEVLTGYVLTENILVSGFNYYFLIAIFLIVIISVTVIPIIYKNWKKQKKANQTISTSPHKTSK